MLNGTLYPEMFVSLLAIFALNASSHGTKPTSPCIFMVEVYFQQSYSLYECPCSLDNDRDHRDCKSSGSEQKWNLTCERSSEFLPVSTECYRCDLESMKKTICTDVVIIKVTGHTPHIITCDRKSCLLNSESRKTTSLSSKVSSKVPSATTLLLTSSSSIVSRAATLMTSSSSSVSSSAADIVSRTSLASLVSREAALITTSSSLALSLPRGTVSPTSSLSVASKVATPITTSSLSALSPEAVTVSPTSSSSIVSRLVTLITKSSPSALSLPGGEGSPTSWSSRVVTPMTASSSASSSAAEIVSTRSLSSLGSTVSKTITTSSSAALSSVAGTVFPTSSSSILLSVKRLSPASPSQIVLSEAALSLTTLSSVVLSAPKFSLEPSSLIVSSAAMLASSSILSPSSRISSGRSLLSVPPSSVLSSTVLSFLVPSAAAVEPTTISSPIPTPAFPSAPFSISSSSPSQKLANDTVSELDSLNITSNNSLQEAANVFENFITKYREMTLGEEQPGVDKLRTESIFKVAVAFEKVALSYGKYHLSGTKGSKRIVRDNIFLGIQKGYRKYASNFYLEKQEWQASINISSGNIADNGSVIVGCVYKDLHDLIQKGHDKTRHVVTRIMMATMDPKPENLQENVILKFKNLKNDLSEKHCMFWSGLSNSQDGFSKDGCHVVTSQSNSEETVCSCNHLTHFAVLVDYGSHSVLSQKDEDVLEIITYLGLSLSIIGMILTIIMYSLFAGVHEPLPQIRLSLAASLGAGQISFLAGMHAVDNPAICITAAVLTQYFLMAAFCWMLVEGIYFYLFIVKVYNISNRLIVYHVISWGIPVIMVSTSLSIAIGKGGIQSYTSNKYCWLSSAYDLIWIFVAFLTATGVLGSFILVRVTRELNTLPQIGANKIQRVRLGIRTCVLMIPLLGITWLFGLLSPLHKAFTYIFTILNSTQGVLIFILHCLRNSQIRERLRGKIKTAIDQIRAPMKARTNAVFPSPNDRRLTKKNVKMNPTDGGAVWANKLHPFD